jgi:hypothetical protein
MCCPGWSSSLVENKAQSLLIIGTMQRLSNRLYDSNRKGSKHKNIEMSPAVSLEVIDTSIAQENWLGVKAEHQGLDNTKSLSIPMYECSVWPAAGMEIKDGWTRDSSKSFRQNRGPRNISVTNAIREFDVLFMALLVALRFFQLITCFIHLKATLLSLHRALPFLHQMEPLVLDASADKITAAGARRDTCFNAPSLSSSKM